MKLVDVHEPYKKTSSLLYPDDILGNKKARALSHIRNSWYADWVMDDNFKMIWDVNQGFVKGSQDMVITTAYSNSSKYGMGVVVERRGWSDYARFLELRPNDLSAYEVAIGSWKADSNYGIWLASQSQYTYFYPAFAEYNLGENAIFGRHWYYDGGNKFSAYQDNNYLVDYLERQIKGFNYSQTRIVSLGANPRLRVNAANNASFKMKFAFYVESVEKEDMVTIMARINSIYGNN